jgi:hypothetical protein
MVRILENYVEEMHSSTFINARTVFTLKGSNIKLPLILIFESRIFWDYGISRIINEVTVFQESDKQQRIYFN